MPSAAATGSTRAWTRRSGAITLGTPYARRTPWYIQSDLNAKHDIKVGDHENISFEATASNALNQHAVVAYWQGMNSLYYATPLYPGVGVTVAPSPLPPVLRYTRSWSPATTRRSGSTVMAARFRQSRRAAGTANRISTGWAHNTVRAALHVLNRPRCIHPRELRRGGSRA